MIIKSHDITHDIIIIGAGIVGAAIAYELAKYELEILVLEKEAEPSFGVSKSNSGIIHTGFQSPATSLKGKLAVRGNKLYSDLAQKLDLPLKQIGELVVAFEEELPKLEEMQKNGQELGVPDLQIVDRAWLDQHEPNLNQDIQYALLGPTAAVINPYEAVYALLENALANQAQLHCSEKVLSIQSQNSVWQVTTEKAVYKTRYVINAAGLFADEISQLAGILCPKIIPRKGEEFLLDRHIQNLTERVIFPVPKPDTKGVLIIPTVDGNYMLGPTATEIEDKTDLSTSQAGKEKVLKAISNLVKWLPETIVITSFAGLRPALKNGDFYIQEDQPGFVNLVGIQSPGLTAAPAIAEHVREIIEKKQPLKTRVHYQSERKAIPRFRDLPLNQKNTLIQQDPDFGEIICRCEEVTKAEIKMAIQRGACTLDGIKFHTRAQMGRCHGSFCTAKIMTILKDELGLKYQQITKRGKGTEIVY
ncbi:NAD(P)/FAD-dependent oxidoreductase [bacterium]|jgi:glycerol-3-phosphate dehydrogenase|nr:NAD(P)/FAD-dependent oxidoreductase [bacterium]MBT4552674.1 NAD(P)/FAD-dependent oxidoreductase [bacterium]MBT7088308.1 NAD(P)/FAD-dependent oxidoreductase [bacterium]